MYATKPAFRARLAILLIAAVVGLSLGLRVGAAEPTATCLVGGDVNLLDIYYLEGTTWNAEKAKKWNMEVDNSIACHTPYCFLAQPKPGYACSRWIETIMAYGGSSTTTTNLNRTGNLEYGLALRGLEQNELATLSASATACVYQVTLDLGEGVGKGSVNPSKVLVEYGNKYPKLPEPVWTGHAFQGWYNEDSRFIDEKTVYQPEEPGNHMLTASWGDQYCNISVTTTGDGGGDVEGGGKYLYGATGIELIAKPYVGCYFVQWQGGSTTNPRRIDARGDTAYEAIFSLSKVRFVDGSSTVGSEKSIIKVQMAERGVYFRYPDEFPTLAKDGKKFLGWSLVKGDGGKKVEAGQEVGKVDPEGLEKGHNIIELHALWQDLSWTITFAKNANDATGEMGSIFLSSIDQEKNLLANKFKREGFAFKGWNTQADGKGTDFEDKELVSVSGNFPNAGEVIKLYAQWREFAYSIRYLPGEDGEGTMQTKGPYPFSSQVTLPTAKSLGFSCRGQDFSKWRCESTGDLLDAGDTVSKLASNDVEVVDLTAQWTRRSYVVEFEGNFDYLTGKKTNEVWYYDQSYCPDVNAFTNYLAEFCGWSTNTVSAEEVGRYWPQGQAISNLTTQAGATVRLFAVWRDLRDEKFMRATGCSNLVIYSKDYTGEWMKRTSWATEAEFTYSRNDGSEGQSSRLEAEIHGPGKLEFTWRIRPEVEGVLPSALKAEFDFGGNVQLRTPTLEWRTEYWVYNKDFSGVAKWCAEGSGGRVEVRNVRWTPGAFDSKWYLAYDAAGGDWDCYDPSTEVYALEDKATSLAADKWPHREGYELKKWCVEREAPDVFAEWTGGEKEIKFYTTGNRPYSTNANDAFVAVAVWEASSPGGSGEEDDPVDDPVNDYRAALGCADLEFDSLKWCHECKGASWSTAKDAALFANIKEPGTLEFKWKLEGGKAENSLFLGDGENDSERMVSRGWITERWVYPKDGFEAGCAKWTVKSVQETLYVKDVVWDNTKTDPVWFVHYEGNGGTIPAALSNAEVKVAGGYRLPDNGPTRPGYVLDGWTDTPGGAKKWSKGETIHPQVNEKLTLYPVWEELEESYTIRFNSNGGNGMMADETMPVGEAKPLTKNQFSKTGYSFAGWAEASGASAVKYTDGQAVKLEVEQGDTVDLYAVWTANVYRVSYEKNNADASGTMTAEWHKYDQAFILPECGFTVDAEQYAFSGWCTNKDGQAKIWTAGTTVSNLTAVGGGSVLVYAIWHSTAVSELSKAVGFELELTTDVDPNAWCAGEDDKGQKYITNGSADPGVSSSTVWFVAPSAGEVTFNWRLGENSDKDFACVRKNRDKLLECTPSGEWKSETVVVNKDDKVEWVVVDSEGATLYIKSIHWEESRPTRSE